jgi:hypothetical protein
LEPQKFFSFWKKNTFGQLIITTRKYFDIWKQLMFCGFMLCVVWIFFLFGVGGVVSSGFWGVLGKILELFLGSYL